VSHLSASGGNMGFLFTGDFKVPGFVSLLCYRPRQADGEAKGNEVTT